MGLEFVKDNLNTLLESIKNYEKISKEKGEDSEEARSLKKLLVELCNNFKKNIAESRKTMLKDGK